MNQAELIVVIPLLKRLESTTLMVTGLVVEFQRYFDQVLANFPLEQEGRNKLRIRAL
ncbi:hypothetical protein [Coleofasciculus sp. E2-BRE-01]|uniref:hypothetical protein n=1 Tax=Coleofasciculus sp. E2-BRE-01 TaxID=3069524 RepID=UPI003301C230